MLPYRKIYFVLLCMVCVQGQINANVVTKSPEITYDYVAKENVHKTYDLYKTFNRYIPQEKFIDRFKALIETNNYFVVTARDKNKPIGLIGFSIQTNGYWGKFVHVDSLIVHEEYRRQGIATKLMKFPESLAKKIHASRLTLETGLTRQDAIRFYEKIGMKKAAIEYRYDYRGK